MDDFAFCKKSNRNFKAHFSVKSKFVCCSQSIFPSRCLCIFKSKPLTFPQGGKSRWCGKPISRNTGLRLAGKTKLSTALRCIQTIHVRLTPQERARERDQRHYSSSRATVVSHSALLYTAPVHTSIQNTQKQPANSVSRSQFIPLCVGGFLSRSSWHTLTQGIPQHFFGASSPNCVLLHDPATPSSAKQPPQQ